MTELSNRARGVVGAAQRAMRPTSADRARVRAALAAKLGAGALSSPAPTRPPAPLQPAPKASALRAFRAPGLAALALVVGLLGRAATTHERVDTLAEAGVFKPIGAIEVIPEEPAPLVTVEPVAAVVPEAEAPRVPAKSASKPARPAEDASSLEAELSLLHAARRALRSEDPKGSLAKLDELEAAHPRGVLQEERLASQVLALCAAGDVARAKTTAARFLAESPGSPLAVRVRASCAFAPSKSNPPKTER